MKRVDLSKYINEDDLAGLDATPMGMDSPVGGSGKKIEDIPGDSKEKAIAAATAAVDELKKKLISIEALDTMHDKIEKACDGFKEKLKARIQDGLAPANKPWSDEN